MSERMIRLKAPEGIAAVEYGGEMFPVKNGHVIVPSMAEQILRLDLGFAFPDSPVPRAVGESRPILTTKKK